ncbi:MAG: hypothetical protein M3R59_00575 [Verrucomicrobiota bacterium]|nr:hypothetical protein [Verrucomicrobiota bacterium]
MNIPFRDLFMKVRARVISARTPAASAPAALPAPLNKTEGDKFAKTVVPNAVHTIAPDPAAPERGTSPGGPRIVSFGRAPANLRARDLPPAVALALEPNVERVLSLALSDVLDHIPAGHIKPRESFDVSRRVLLKASEVEKGMAVGRPAVALATLYQQMPEIFMHPVPAAEAAMVALPFEKVIGELTNLHVRNDQQTEIVPQVQTPFLQVTIEDHEKFGTKMEPITINEMPAVRVELATAQALAAAQPEATASERFTASRPTAGQSPAPEVEATETEASVSMPAGAPEVAAPVAPEARARIPFTPSSETATSANGTTPSPNGTGGPAQTRVPASGGPPVPTSAPTSPTRIPFKLSTPAEPPTAAPATLGLGALGAEPIPLPAPESAAPAVDESGPVVTLSLLPILRSLPPMQAKQDPSDVPADAQVSFPMGLVAPQLASGKVVIHPQDFHKALTPAFQKYFDAAAVDVPVPLSLPDVLSHLPGDALRMRDDQEVLKQDEAFETPFSAKAAEDAARFSAPPDAEAKPAEVKPEPVPPASVEKPEAPVEKAPAVAAKELVVAAPKNETAAPIFEAKDAIAKACALPGVASCSLIFADGLGIAGNIPQEMRVEGVSAVAPTLLKKLEKHMLDTQLGSLTCITIHGEKSPVSLFLRGNVCLTAVHNGAELNAASRQELAQMTEELSHTYTQPETAHVDH